MIAEAPTELLVDEYQLAMADSYLAQGTAGAPAAFELSVRSLPPQRGYLVVAGIARAAAVLREMAFGDAALEYLERAGTCSAALCRHLAGLRFTGSLDAMPEGTVAHAGEPILRVEGGLLACQLAESLLLNQVVFQTAVASKAARVVTAAAGRPVVDFGFRRAHGADAGLLAARAAYIAGCSATATVAAGFMYGVPTSGTMAHSYVLSFRSEADAYAAFLRDHPDRSTLLVDTYDPIAGVAAAIEASRRTRVVPQAVRLDGGELETLVPRVRAALDAGGLRETRIVCSGDLDEFRIADLLAAGTPVDGFGVGTALTTSVDAPALAGVYKLVEVDGRPVRKRAGWKATLPGRHQVFRDGGGDVIGLVGEDVAGDPLLAPVLRDGAATGPEPPLAQARDRCAAQVAALPARLRAIGDPDTLTPRHSPQLHRLEEELA